MNKFSEWLRKIGIQLHLFWRMSFIDRKWCELKENNMIQSIRREVEDNIGRKVQVRADKGRKRIITKEGIIENAFEDVFTVRVSNEFDVERTVSYTYTDVLTSTVKLTVY